MYGLRPESIAVAMFACLPPERWSIYTQGNLRILPASYDMQVQMAASGRCLQLLVSIKAGADCRYLPKGSCSWKAAVSGYSATLALWLL